MNRKEETTAYTVYRNMMGLTIGILGSIWIFFMYYLWPGLSSIHPIAALIVEGVLALVPITYLALWLIFVVILSTNVPMANGVASMVTRGLYTLFTPMVGVGRLFGIKKSQLSQSLIEGINHMVLRRVKPVDPAHILLLTPHCLQRSECIYKVTTNVDNCRQCGGCYVGELLALSRKYGCQFVVVTGGTLARMMVKSKNPEAIIAIACERDLVSGMKDVFPIPVVGILNERPFGPCYNTRVDMEKVEKAVQRIIHGRTNS